MSAQQKDSRRQLSQTNTLDKKENNINGAPHVADFELQAPRNGHSQNEHSLVHFSGHFNGQFNGAFMVPNVVYESAPADNDAQIAARRAMAKRSSRSFASRVSRNRSRKMEVVGQSAKPGITVDTSFTRHRGNVPHQMYPQESEIRTSGGSIRKQGWFGLGRSNTKAKGLGITKGTAQPEIQSQSSDRRLPPHSDFAGMNDLKTADSLTPGSKTWNEISPWDRPIPIGISVPSDSVTDFSPYQGSRNRSDSDATLATPSIIITPAAAMKSVWSPDTESDYTPARASSIYSRATFMQTAESDVPPVPALPPGVGKLPTERSGHDVHRGADGPFATRNRSDTVDSAGTAFEEEDDVKRKDRIMSTGTVFEEDNTPLRDNKAQSTLAVNTATTPSSRRSQGWWNIITTPFVTSPSYSVWTQNGPQPNNPPEVSTMFSGHQPRVRSPSTPSTYIWSATEHTPSTNGSSPLIPRPLATAAAAHTADPRTESHEVTQNILLKTPPLATNKHEKHEGGAADVPKLVTGPARQTETANTNIASPLSAMSASPVVATAAIGTVLMPRQVEKLPEPLNVAVNIELQDRRPQTSAKQPATNAPPAKLTIKIPSAKGDRSPPKLQKAQQAVPSFPPPPTYDQKGVHSSYWNDSQASSLVSPADLKEKKKHRKAGNMMSKLVLCRRKKDNKDKKDKKQKKKRSVCFWCCGCCIIILLLLAIIIPIVVVFTKKHDKSGPVGTPSQWLNLTGYPPIPTGVSTIAQPEAVKEENGCVAPATAWSCAVPKEQQKDINPNKPDQPNFKLEILFQNGTVPDASKTRPLKRAINPVSAGAFIRSRLLNTRAAPSASPAAPSVADRKFLGQTTEKVSAPFEGEDTPFFITFQDAKVSLSPRYTKRQDDSNDDINNITSIIPPPMLDADGTAAPANLQPYPSSQPLRLFNRGKADEHYGFYTYFDRSIFLKAIDDQSGRGGNPSDVDGGSFRDAAKMRCTYSQTRFLFQIWTRSQTTKPLLRSSALNSSDATLARPGTFPYPVTVTLDRHGGDSSKKNLYCYNMENDTTIVNETKNKFMIAEDRAFGGVLASPANGFINITTPIDGGTGGCGCTWQNWLA